MPTNDLWAGLLSQLLIHQETGCPHSARHAIRLLDQLCESEGLDPDVQRLCERASFRLGQRWQRHGQVSQQLAGRSGFCGEGGHACSA